MTVEKLLQLGRKGFSTQIHAETLAFDKSILLAEMQAKAELNPELKPFVVAYLSASQDHHWFHAHPAAHGTQLRNDEWRFAICLCFGLPIWDPTRLTIGFHTPHSTCNQCKVNMGEFAAYGFHAFHCSRDIEKESRYSAMPTISPWALKVGTTVCPMPSISP